MTTAHHDHTELIRLTMAIAMLVTGLAAFARPRWFAGAAGCFTRSGDLSSVERDRLDRVVSAREAAEGISGAYGRYIGIAAFVLAAFEFLPGVPFALPYALLCLASAAVIFLAYLQFRRATEQRVAPLVRRSPFAALPPVLIASIGASLAAAIMLAIYPPARFGAIAVAIATMILGYVAWRIADAPALLVGVDPQFEYAVDERLRIGRARNVASLACAPALVLVAISEPSLPELYGVLGSAAVVVLAAAFAIALAASIWPVFSRIRLA